MAEEETAETAMALLEEFDEEEEEEEEDDEEEDNETQNLKFYGEMDPLDFALKDSSNGDEIYLQFQRLEYEALAERKRKALLDPQNRDEQAKKLREEGAAMEVINEFMNFRIRRRRSKEIIIYMKPEGVCVYIWDHGEQDERVDRRKNCRSLRRREEKRGQRTTLILKLLEKLVMIPFIMHLKITMRQFVYWKR